MDSPSGNSYYIHKDDVQNLKTSASGLLGKYFNAEKIDIGILTDEIENSTNPIGEFKRILLKYKETFIS